MIRNYFLIGIRSLRKHFSYSIINIAGLSLGLTVGLLLVIWIRHELSYDQFHVHAPQLYRASLEYSFGGQTAKTSVSPTALLPAFQKNFPEVIDGIRLYNPSAWTPYIVQKEDQIFLEKKFYFADSTFFHLFSFRLLEGNAEKALSLPHSVILTKSIAKKYFGDNDPIGKTLTVNNVTEYIITGVMENPPSQSLLQFEFLASFSSLDASRTPIWWSANYQTFLLLSPRSDANALRDKGNALVKKELASELSAPGDYVKYNIMPMTDIYLKSETDEPEIVGSIQYIYIFGAIAFLVLVVACINYINLATARAAERAKEVGIRKVVGALRKQLFYQFIIESILITGLSFFLAFITAGLILPFFNSITGKQFAWNMLMEPIFLGYSLLACLVIAFIAGAYPALAITSFKPVSVLKGNFKSSSKGLWLRQSLVVFQFGITIVLMVGTMIILKQLDFIQTKRLGYDKENIIVLPLDRKNPQNYQPLKLEFQRTGKVANMGRAIESPTKIAGGYGINVEGGPDNKSIGMVTTAMSIDKDFIPTMGMKIILGRNFNESDFLKMEKDTVSSFILNETALKELHLPKENAVGTKVKLDGRKGSITGIVEDFHFSSLHEKIRPLVLFIENDQLQYIFVKLNSGDMKATLTELKKVYGHVIPYRPFEFEFLDQQYQKLYDKEQRMGAASSVFASLTILIACLGLFGLVAFSAAQKTKEIGIRKVMGATAGSIVLLITKDYTRLVLMAIVLGLPSSYFLMENGWLNKYAYHTQIGIWPFLLATATCVIIAFVTASFQALKAALVDPANTLRSE